MLNVEGDAFGAALLQFFVDRNAAKEGQGSELTEVRLGDGDGPAKPEHSPLIEKRGLPDSPPAYAPGARPSDMESVM